MLPCEHLTPTLDLNFPLTEKKEVVMIPTKSFKIAYSVMFKLALCAHNIFKVCEFYIYTKDKE